MWMCDDVHAMWWYLVMYVCFLLLQHGAASQPCKSAADVKGDAFCMQISHANLATHP